MQNSSATVVVYDVTGSLSLLRQVLFVNASQWVSAMREEQGLTYMILLLWNKADLEEKRKISMRKDRREQTSGTLFSRSEFQEGARREGSDQR